MSKDEDQDARIAENRDDIKSLKTEMGNMQTEQAVQSATMTGIDEKVTTGFLDLKDVIVAGNAQRAARETAAHELAILTAQNRQKLLMQVLGIISAGVAAGGVAGGGYYAMAEEPAAVSAPAPTPAAAPSSPAEQ